MTIQPCMDAWYAQPMNGYEPYPALALALDRHWTLVASNGMVKHLLDGVVPFQLATPTGVLSLISTTTIFGTPIDVTLSELALETFFPADAATAQALHGLA